MSIIAKCCCKAANPGGPDWPSVAVSLLSKWLCCGKKWYCTTACNNSRRLTIVCKSSQELTMAFISIRRLTISSSYSRCLSVACNNSWDEQKNHLTRRLRARTLTWAWKVRWLRGRRKARKFPESLRGFWLIIQRNLRQLTPYASIYQ